MNLEILEKAKKLQSSIRDMEECVEVLEKGKDVSFSVYSTNIHGDLHYHFPQSLYDDFIHCLKNRIIQYGKELDSL